MEDNKLKKYFLMKNLNVLFWIGYIILLLDNFIRYPIESNNFLNFITDPFQWITMWWVIITLIYMNFVLSGNSKKYTDIVTLILFIPFLYVYYQLFIDIYSDIICSNWYLCNPIFPSTILSYIGNILVGWISVINILFLIFLSKNNKKTEE